MSWQCLGIWSLSRWNVSISGYDLPKSFLLSNRRMDGWAKVSWTSKSSFGSSGDRCYLLPYEVDHDWASTCLKESLQGVQKETRAHDNGILHMRTLELVNARVSHGITSSSRE